MNLGAVLQLLVTANTTPANVALAGTQKRLIATASTAQKSGKLMKASFASIGLAAGAAAVAVFKIGEEFDDAYDTIRTKTGATGKELKKLEGNFKDVVSSVPTDFDSAATAVAGLNQRLGLTGRPLTQLSKQVTQLSKITGTDVQENVESITRLFGDWSVKTEDQTETLDGLYRLTQQTGIGLSDMARSMVQFGSPLRQLGLGFDETAAMFAKFEKEGVNIQTLLPGFKQAIGHLAQPTSELTRLTKELGVSLKGDFADQLSSVFDALGRLKDEQEAAALAAQVFGTRAGPDMAAAIREGRFELGDLLRTMKDGDATISGAERSTRDFSEQWTLFVNRAKVFLEPVATAFFKAVGDAMKALNRLDLHKVGESLREFWQKAQFLRDVFGKVTSAIKENFRGLAQFIGGAVKVVSGVLTGDFHRAWDGVKDIFSSGVKNVIAIFKGMTAPIREVAERLAEIVTDVLGGAWKRATNIVENAANDILGSVHLLTVGINKGFKATVKLTNQALDAFGAKNKVEFDVDTIDPFQKGGIVGAQRGILVPGSGTGDKVPAMLEPGEVVINRTAVAALGGANRANSINSAIPRFASGGVIQQALGPYSIPPIQYDPNHAGGNSHLHLDFWTAAQALAFGHKMQGMGWSIGEYTPTHGNPFGFGGVTTQHQSPGHYDGTAFDANTAADETRAQVAAIARMLGGAGGGLGAAAAEIARVILKGPDGPLKSMGQAALDRVRSAANAYIGRQTAVTGGQSDFAPSGGGALSRGAMRGLLGKVGLPDIMGWVALAESGFNPNAHNPSGASGLWQIMMPLHAGLVASAGGNVFDPLTNARVAKMLYSQSGLTPWEASRAGWQPHVGQPFATGGIAQAPASPNVNVTNRIDGGGAMAWLERFIDTRVEKNTRNAARGRPMPGVRG